MANKINHGLPSLAPDKDQVDAFRNTRTKTGSKSTGESNNNVQTPALTVKQRRSGWVVFFNLIIFSLIGVGGWWFYQKDLQTQSLIQASERRIQELEQQLSVTGEEMGESTVAMKVRLEKLTRQTEELWVQMDKLWASAWRRNQAEIQTLNTQSKTLEDKLSKQSKQSETTVASLKAISQKQTEAEFNVGILAEQVQSAEQLKNQLIEIKNELNTLQAKSLSGDKQQIELAGLVSQLNNTQKILLQRIERLDPTTSNTVPQ